MYLNFFVTYVLDLYNPQYADFLALHVKSGRFGKSITLCRIVFTALSGVYAPFLGVLLSFVKWQINYIYETVS